MGNEPPSDDPLNIWQNQPTEPPQMTLEEIRHAKTKALRAKSRRNALAHLVIAAFFAVMFVNGHDAIERTILGLAIVWALAVQLPAMRRAWSQRPAGDAGSVTSVEFYRKELEYRINQIRKPWPSFVGPVLLGCGGLLVPAIKAVIRLRQPALAINAAPFLVLLALWVVLYYRIVRQEIRQLQLEIAELNALERERLP